MKYAISCDKLAVLLAHGSYPSEEELFPNSVECGARDHSADKPRKLENEHVLLHCGICGQGFFPEVALFMSLSGSEAFEILERDSDKSGTRLLRAESWTLIKRYKDAFIATFDRTNRQALMENYYAEYGGLSLALPVLSVHANDFRKTFIDVCNHDSSGVAKALDDHGARYLSPDDIDTLGVSRIRDAMVDGILAVAEGQGLIERAHQLLAPRTG